MPRADEYEGILNNTEEKRIKDRIESRSNKVMREDMLDLTENDAFLRFFGRFAYPALTQDFPVNNGSLLAEFNGERKLVLRIVREMDSASPGFLRRLLVARDQYESDLLAYGQQKENDRG